MAASRQSVAFSDMTLVTPSLGTSGLPPSYGSAAAAITLFGSDQSIGGNETLPYKNTTYEPKPIQTAPLLRGNIYLQDPLEVTHRTAKSFNLAAMSVQQLYSSTLNSYRAQQRRHAEVRGSFLPPAPPDFDGEQLTNPEAVAQFVNGLAASYNHPLSVQDPPSPYDMYDHLIHQFLRLTPAHTTSHATYAGDHSSPAARRSTMANTSAGSPASLFPTPGGPIMPSSPSHRLPPMLSDSDRWAMRTGGGAGDVVAGGHLTLSALLPPASLQGTAGLEVANLSILLSNPSNLTLASLAHVSQVLKRQPELASRLPAEIVDAFIQQLRDSAAGGAAGLSQTWTPDQQGVLCSIVVRLVLQRRQLGELLQLMLAVEALPRQVSSLSSSSIVPNTIPMFPIEEMDQFTLGPFTSSNAQTPLDVCHGETKTMPTEAPEGVGVASFAVSCDGKCLALATSDGFLRLCDATTGDLLQAVPLPSGISGCWSVLFSSDDGDILFSDLTGKHHVIFSTKGLVSGQRHDFDEPRLARYLPDGTLVFVLPPELPALRHKVAALRLISSERINIPLPLPVVSATPPNSFGAFGAVNQDNFDSITASISTANPQTPSAFPTTGPSALVGTIAASEVTVFAMVDVAFQGIVATIDGSDEVLSVQVRNGSVLLTHTTGSCQAVLPSSKHWIMLCATWSCGVWTLLIDDAVSDLRGVRVSQRKSLRIQSAFGLCGTGLLGTVAAWCGIASSATLRSLLRHNVLPTANSTSGATLPNYRPLFHVPLDEGGGWWLKETVTQSAITLSPSVGYWDAGAKGPFPLAGATVGPRGTSEHLQTVERAVVRLPAHVMLGSHVLHSHYQVVLLLPPALKGCDGTVIVVTNDAQRVHRVYQDTTTLGNGSSSSIVSSGSDTLLFLNHDESIVYSYAPRFGVFSLTTIVSSRKRLAALRAWEKQELARQGAAGVSGARGESTSNASAASSRTTDILSSSENSDVDDTPSRTATNLFSVPSSQPHTGIKAAQSTGPLSSPVEGGGILDEDGGLPAGTVQWLLRRLYTVLFVEGTQLLRLPPSLSPINSRNMITVCACLRSCARPGSNKLRVLSMLTLGIVHFIHLSEEHDTVVERVAAMLSIACKQIIAEHANDPLISEVAKELFRVGVSNSLTPAHKAEVLASADHTTSGDILEQYLARESIHAIVTQLVRHSPESLVHVTQGLLRRCELERRSAIGTGPEVTGTRITGLVHWFLLSAARECCSAGLERSILYSILLQLFDAVEPLLLERKDDAWGSELQETVVHSGFLPTLIFVTQMCPSIIDSTLEGRLRTLLHLGCKMSGAPKFKKWSMSPASASYFRPDGSALSSAFGVPATVDGQQVGPSPPANEQERSTAFLRPHRNVLEQSERQSSNCMDNISSSILGPSQGGLPQIAFRTRQACDIVPSGGSQQSMDESVWRLLLDIPSAATVTISKASTSADVTLLVISDQPNRQSNASNSSPVQSSPMMSSDFSAMTMDGFQTSPNASSSLPARRILSHATPSLKVEGGTYLLYGTGENSLTVVCQYDLNVDSSYHTFLRHALFRALLRVANHLLERPMPCDVFLAPLMRHGLTKEALQRHGISLLADRQSDPTIASQVLTGTGEGKAVVESVVRSMRGLVTAAMRPAVQALLAILIHCGTPPQQAEEELKLRWFSGEWGSKLQGEDKEDARCSLVNLAQWLIENVHNVSSTGALSPIRRQSSSDRRVSDFLGRSANTNRASMLSTSDRRSSNNSSQRRSTTSKSGVSQNEILDQVRALFTKGIAPSALEDILVSRTQSAITITRGLDILYSLVTMSATTARSEELAAAAAQVDTVRLLGQTPVNTSLPPPSALTLHAATPTDASCVPVATQCSEQECSSILESLLQLIAPESGSAGHVVESLVGCGGDLELALRRQLHVVVAAVSKDLLSDTSNLQPASPHALLTAPAPRGRPIMRLLSVLCHPWDSTDSEFLVDKRVDDSTSKPMVRVVSYLDNLARLTVCTAPPCGVESPSAAADCLTPPAVALAVPPNAASLTKQDLLSIADEASLNRVFPNNFSLSIPGTLFTRTDGGVAVDRSESGSISLRADEGWTLSWCDGLPRVYYFEVTFQSSLHRVSVALSQKKTNPEGSGRLPQEQPLFSYDNRGLSNDVGGPPYGDGDTVGCGLVVSSGRVFFTVNGVFLGFAGTVPERVGIVFPTILMENHEPVRCIANFGSKAFHYDFRALHPSLALSSGPTVGVVSATAATVLHVMAARACAMHDMRRVDTRAFLHGCTVATCNSANLVTSTLRALAAVESNDRSAASPTLSPDPTSKIHAALRITTCERHILKLVATLRHVVRMVSASSSSGALLTEEISDEVFKTVSMLMVLPLHSVKIATIGLLPEVLPLLKQAHVDDRACAMLVSTLFDLVKAPARSVFDCAASAPLVSPLSAAAVAGSDPRVPFVPSWLQCDSQFVSITNAQHAQMLPEKQRSIILGSVLPRTGVVSFSVRITRETMTKGHSLKGGYFIGVAIANLAPLSPISNSHSWKVVKPPVVWALHDTSPQLPHAVNPTVKPNNFQRTFGSGDVITVVVNRDAQTIAFYRDDVFLKDLYQDVPQDLDLVPFAQLYNDDASIDIGPGEISAVITPQLLLSAASVDVLRSMFALRPFERHVARHVTEELNTDPWPSVSLSVFASLPDPRNLMLRHGVHEESPVVVRRVSDGRCKFTLGDATYHDWVQNFRAPSKPIIRGKLDVNFVGAAVDGIMECIDALVGALSRIAAPLVTIEALEASERLRRQELWFEERDAWDTLFIPRRVALFETMSTSTKVGIKDISRSAPVPFGFVFSQPLSHPGFTFSNLYCGRLVAVPSGASNTTTPFIAIAEPALPLTGKFSIRCQLIRGHHGQILGGGYYFGVCASTFTWKRRDMHVVPPEVWALHDMEDVAWRLKHLTVDRRLPFAAEPNCLLVSGDIVRLEIDRDEGTVHAYRKPANSPDEIFIGFLYDNLPKAPVELFPFVHIYNTDAVAVMLPSTPASLGIRTTVQQPVFALSLYEKRNCDGCVSQHRETKLSGANEWFKCNDCADYNLCSFCFNNFVHSHHAFTKMDARLMVHSKHPPSKVATGASLIVSGSTSVYLKSVSCVLPAENMSSMCHSAKDDSMCVWGLIHTNTDDPSFTIRVATSNGSALSTNRPVFVGIGEASEVLSLSAEDLRKKCVTGFSSGLSVCSDSRVRRKLTNPSAFPHGFTNGNTITMTVQYQQQRARIVRDWIDVGTLALPQNFTPGTRLVGFILFGAPNITASIAPERNPYTLVTVAEVLSNEVVRVTDPSGFSRYCAVQDCRVPVVSCMVGTPKPDQLMYAFQNKTLSVCKVLHTDKNDAVVSFPHDNSSVQRVPVSHLFVPIAGDVGLSTESGGRSPSEHVPQGATIMNGFVMSRLLMILSCMMEDMALAPLLHKHAPRFLPLLQRLASVRISNDAPAQFLSDVRAAIASTAQVPRIQKLLQRSLTPFLPPASLEVNDRTVGFPVKQGMLVSIIDGALRGTFFRAQSDGTDSFRAEPLDGGQPAIIKAAACVPVKQCAGQPWWRVADGLPCSVVEHTLRSEEHSTTAAAVVKVSLEGEWHGELITSQNANMSMSLSLRVEPDASITGSARVVIPDGRTIDVKVRGEHMRYSRLVKLRCSYSAVGSHMSLDELRNALRSVGFTAGAEMSKEDMVVKLTQLCENIPTPTWFLKGTLDAEGLRVGGTWKHSEGLSGNFTISSLRGVSLVANTSTPLLHVEPLPECQDLGLPPSGARDVYTLTHQLVVQLARHLYLSYVGCSAALAKEISKDVIHFHAHPLTERLIAYLNDLQPQRFHRILCEAIALVMDPRVLPWDSATLSSIITNSVLLKANGVDQVPSVYWDALHAVVSTAHRCGEEYRRVVLRNVVQLIQDQPQTQDRCRVLEELLTSLCTWVDTRAVQVVGITPVRRDVAAGVEMLLVVPRIVVDKTVTCVPLAPLRCLIDISESLQNNVSLPLAVETAKRGDMASQAVDVLCPFGQYADGELKVGKVMSSVRTSSPNGKFYFEVTLPEKTNSAFAVGWGTQAHTDIPSQHVGSDIHSFAFTGNQIVVKQVKEEYKVGADISNRAVVGCLLDLSEKVAAWSINGFVGAFVPIPVNMMDLEFYAFTSTGSCSGMKIHLAAAQFQYVPDGYSDLAGRMSGIHIATYDATQRSLHPPRPVSFFVHVAAYLSDVYAPSTPQTSSANNAGAPSSPASGQLASSPLAEGSPLVSMYGSHASRDHEQACLRKYTQLSSLTPAELDRVVNVIQVVESCMSTARRFVDLEGDSVQGNLANAFLFIKQLATRNFRRKLVEIPGVDKNPNPVNLTVRLTDLYSSLPRSPEAAMHHSILSQLYRQIGAFTGKQLLQTPLFKVHLYMTQSGHAPQDMGGPYRQLWSLVGDEVMTHPDKCYPHTDFHRNPLFRFVNNSQRVSLVPDHAAVSPMELNLFTFLGKILGHMARARTPIPLDMSPFVWKFLVEDALTIKDYYAHVDSVVERSMEDDEFLLSDVAEDVIPNYADAVQRELERRGAAEASCGGQQQILGGSLSGSANSLLTLEQMYELPTAVRRSIAEDCLVHSMDCQLMALRDGVWSVLPKRVTRCLCWQDLERAVCGDAMPTFEQMRDSIIVQTQPLREQFFWRLVEEMTGAQRSTLLCFACGQKRLPLVKKVRVTENSESQDHLPRAQSCSALITIPAYTSYDVFKSKMLVAIEHQTEMELA